MSSETMTGISVRIMDTADIPDGMRLKDDAGWNQTEQDWLRLLTLEPEGCFVACEGDRVCGTVTTLQYEKTFGWIGMLLTDSRFRQLGIGTRLLNQAVSYLESSGVETLRLDGTPMGYNLYLRNGFVDELQIERWEGNSPERTGRGLPALQAEDLDCVFRWDRHIFGADRSRLIASLWEENPAFSAVVRRSGEISGYLLWRPGRHAWYVGPWVARSTETAEMLLVEMLSHVPGERVFVDLCMKSPFGVDLLKPRGFRFQRPLVRMYRGPHTSAGEPQFTCAIAGPELG